MKFTIYLILISFFIACSSITDNDKNKTIIYNSEYFYQFDYLLYIQESNIIARINRNINTSELLINDKMLASDSNINSSINKPYSIFGNLDTLINQTDSELNFKWTIDTISYVGNLPFLDEIEIDFEDFEENMNYHLNWSTINNPDNFQIHVQIIDTLGETLINKIWQLSGGSKSFLIPKTIFDVNNKRIISITVASYNYKEWEELLAIIVRTRTQVFKIPK